MKILKKCIKTKINNNNNNNGQMEKGTEITKKQETYIPQKGDMFEWCDEKYWCIESGSYSGVVNPVGETYYQRGFIWNYKNEKQIFIRKATDIEFENIFSVL